MFGPVFLDEVPCDEAYCADDERGEDMCRRPSILLATPDETDNQEAGKRSVRHKQ